MIVIDRKRCIMVILTRDNHTDGYSMWDGRSLYGEPVWDEQNQLWTRSSGGLIETIPESTTKMIFSISREWKGGSKSIRRYKIGTVCER